MSNRLDTDHSAGPSHRLLVPTILCIDGVILSAVSALPGFTGVAALAGVSVGLYCLLSPIGFVLMLTLISHIYELGGQYSEYVHSAKWGIAILLAAAAFTRIIIEERKTDFRLSRDEQCFLVFILWGAICSLFAVNLKGSITEDIRMATFFVVLLIARTTISRKSHLHLIFGAVIISVVAAGLYSLAEIAGEGFFRVRGFFLNANAFGVFLCFAIPIIAMAWMISSKTLSKLLFAGAIAVGVAALLLSWSRAGYLFLAVQGITYLVLQKKKKTLIALVTSAALIALFAAVSSSFFAEVSSLLRLQSRTTHRTALWHQGIEAFMRSPIVGTGYDVPKEAVVENVMWSDLSQYVLYSDFKTRFMPHNQYIYSLMTTGAPGLLLLLLLYFQLLKSQYVSWRSSVSPPQRKLHAIMFSVVVGTMFYNLFETGSIIGHGSWATYFWIALGLVTAIKEKNLLKEEAKTR